MLKNISKLEGAKELNKLDQQTITGGMVTPCSSDADCQAAGGAFCKTKCIINFGICIFDTTSCQ